jgi:hypothetical protein
MNDCSPVPAPAAEPALGVSASGLSGEASRPGLRVPAGALPSGPGPDASEMRMHPVHYPQGRHPANAGSLALRHGSCLLPLKLPFHLIRTTPFSMPPNGFGSYRVSAVITGLSNPAPSFRIAQSATARLPFPLPVATPAGCGGDWSARSAPPDGGPPHWLTVATHGLAPTVFAPCPETPERRA